MRLRLALVAVLAATTAAASLAVADPRPMPRPEAAEPQGVCGDPALVGVALPPIAGEGGCGIAAPVRLDAAAGVALDPPPTLACETARALAAWLETAAKPALPGLTALEVVDGYSCRNRNRAANGKLSEHAFGRALDIGAFRLGDGSRITLLDDWDAPDWGATLRRLHAAACGPFGTVLGPEANPLHADHLHLDVASRRSGPYCE